MTRSDVHRGKSRIADALIISGAISHGQKGTRRTTNEHLGVPMRDVTGRVAFITGGASGVGLGMAKVFCAAGMKVVIADIRQEHLDEAMKSFKSAQVHSIRVDVTDRKAMARAADESERVFGKVHVVCNNGGINLL